MPIPRGEIDEFKRALSEVFIAYALPGSSFEIVGSYRRGKHQSGDIDIIITNSNNNAKTLDTIIDALIKCKLISHVLSRGQTKSLTLVKMSNKPARRVDFMYSPPSEYAFAILYFTGSKSFNTVQRQRALDNGFTLNEHGLCAMTDGVKGDKVMCDFPTEQSIFKFLQMEYKDPCERIDGRSVVIREKITIKRPKHKPDSFVDAFKKNGIQFLETLSEQDICSIIYSANQSYYEGCNPIITDEQYDIITDYAIEKYPTNKKIREGHTTVDMCETTKTKVLLPYEMWSMDKVKPNTDAITKWITKYNGPYVITCKLDGVSCLYVSPDKLYTRGNGKIGQDISNLIPYLRLPKEKNTVIRGELIIQKNLFIDKYKKEFANPRNFVAGTVNQKVPDSDRLRHISFVAYEVIKPTMKPYEQILTLKKLDVETVYCLVKEKITDKILSDILISMRESCEYEIDGLICCDNEIYCRRSGNPEHAFAFKMMLTDQIVQAKVKTVIWSASKDGYIKPRVQIIPVMLGGVNIEYATGFNAKFIVDHKIGAGAVVTIVRSGDVIPHILNVVKPAQDILMPSDNYIWNETGVDIVLVDKSTDAEVNHKVITLFFKTIGVDGLGSGNIKKIIDAGYATIPAILSMTQDQFMEIAGFGEKMSDKIYTGIKEKINEASLPLLMDATNIFGRGFGEKKFQGILLKLPDIIISSNSLDEKVTQLKDINGIASKTAERFVEKLPEFIEWAKCVGVESKLFYKPAKTITTGHLLYGKKIAITGFRDAQLVSAFEQVGAINVGTITKNVFVVIVKDLDEDTNKVSMAKTMGIPLMTPITFAHKFNIEY